MKLESVAVLAKVKAMLVASLVVMVFPLLYAACKEKAVELHLPTTLVVLLTHSMLPVVFPKPEIVSCESASVTNEIPLVDPGSNVTCPLASNAPLAVAVLVKVEVPVTLKLPPTEAPFVTVAEFKVAAPEVESVVNVVAPVTPKVEDNVVAPVTPSVPPIVVSCDKVEVPSTVKLPLKEALPSVSKVEPVPLPVYPPPIATELKVAAAFAALKVVAFKDTVAFLMLAVPVVPPIVKLVALVTKLNVVELEVISPPLTATSPVEILPVDPSKEKWSAAILLEPKERASTILVSDKSIAVSIPPAAEVTFNPAG